MLWGCRRCKLGHGRPHWNAHVLLVFHAVCVLCPCPFFPQLIQHVESSALAGGRDLWSAVQLIIWCANKEPLWLDWITMYSIVYCFFFFAFVGRNRPIGGNTKYFICLYFINHPKKADISFSFHYWPRSQKLPLYFLDACIKSFVFCYSAFSWSRWQMVLESIPVVTGQEPGQAPSTSVSSPPNVHGP